MNGYRGKEISFSPCRGKGQKQNKKAGTRLSMGGVSFGTVDKLDYK